LDAYFFGDRITPPWWVDSVPSISLDERET